MNRNTKYVIDPGARKAFFEAAADRAGDLPARQQRRNMLRKAKKLMFAKVGIQKRA